MPLYEDYSVPLPMFDINKPMSDLANQAQMAELGGTGGITGLSQALSKAQPSMEVPTIDTSAMATPGAEVKAGIGDRLNLQASRIAQSLGATGRKISETLENPQVIAALGQAGAALSSPGSVGARLGGAATQMAQSQIFRKALSDAMAGREIDMGGLTPEQQVRVTQTSQQTQLFKERETAAMKKFERERQSKLYSDAMQKARLGRQDYTLEGLPPEEQERFRKELRQEKAFEERETPVEARERDLSSAIELEKAKASARGEYGEAPDVKRAYDNIKRIFEKVDPTLLQGEGGKVDAKKMLQVLAGGAKVMNESEKTVLFNSVKLLEMLGENTFGLKSGDLDPQKVGGSVIIDINSLGK